MAGGIAVACAIGDVRGYRVLASPSALTAEAGTVALQLPCYR